MIPISDHMNADVLVIGGGLGGVCAAIQAARLGCEVVLVERSMMLGGNSGPDGGVHPSGAHRFHTFAVETGVIEELIEQAAWEGAKTISDDLHYNISPLWDGVLYRALTSAGVRVLRSHYASRPVMDGATIAAVEVEDTATYHHRVIKAHQVIEASGDGAIAALAGAAFRMGREGVTEFGERNAPPEPDSVTMGSSVVGLVRRVGHPAPFSPPPGTPPFFPGYGNYPWFIPEAGDSMRFFFPVETGGQRDTIEDDREIYQKALDQIYAAWNYVKNEKYVEEARDWELVWISPRVLKRESRRFEGDVILTQNDTESGRVFPDAVAFGGFAEDVHHPRDEAREYVKIVYYGVPPLYTIPYRCLYSRNVPNLLFASRLMSVSHMAHGTTRLQRTVAAAGQAAGVAAALCVRYGCSPRDVYTDHLEELQQTLLAFDGSAPGLCNRDPRDLAPRAAIRATSERLYRVDRADRFVPLEREAGVMLWDFPAHLDETRFLLRNDAGHPVTVRASLRLRAYPQKYIVREHGAIQKGFPYEPRVNEVEWADDNRLSIFAPLAEAEAEVPPGVHEVTFVWNRDLLPPDDTSDEERATVTLLPAEGVSMAVDDRFYDFCRRVERDGDEYRGFPDAPVLAVSPARPYGEATNVVDGVNRRFCYNPVHMWQASDDGRNPQSLILEWEGEQTVSCVHLTFDTFLRSYREMPFDCGKRVSPRLVRNYRLDAMIGGEWVPIVRELDNHHRFRRHTFEPVTTRCLRLVVERVWSEEEPARVYEIRVYETDPFAR